MIWFKLFWLGVRTPNAGSSHFLYLPQMNLPVQIRVYKAAVACAAGLWGLSAHGQTVVNGSFEQSSALPAISGQWNLLEGWTNAGSATSDPDFYHLSGSGAADLPETPVAIVPPYDGSAIAGVQVAGAPGSNTREYLCGSFSAPLTVGQRYKMSFALSNGELTQFSLAGVKVSGLGVALGTAPAVQTGNTPLMQTPKYRMNQYLHNADWRELSFEFVADAAYSHFTFGLFGGDSGGMFQTVPGHTPTFAYYFVDDFRIEPVANHSPSAVTPPRGPGVSGGSDAGPVIDGEPAQDWFVPNAFTPNNDGDNDRFEPIIAPGLLRSFKVFNRWGQEVYTCMDRATSPSWDGKSPDGKPVGDGSYYWTLDLQYPDGQFVQKTGAVYVLR